MLAVEGVAPATVALLWAAGSPWPEVDAVRRAAAAAEQLPELARAAELQRVGPLVLRSLHLAGDPIDLSGWATRLVTEAGLRRAQEAVTLPAALKLGVAPLMSAGLEPVVLKGPALLDRYPAHGLRAMDDVDVLVPGADHAVAMTTLEANGWRRVKHPVDPGYDDAFRHPDAPGLALELHRDVENLWSRSSTMSGDALWKTRRPASIAGVDAFVLPPEQELCFLAAHAAKQWHVYSRLIWSVDLVVVVRAGVDWDRAMALAAEYRCRTALAVGLTLAQRLGADAPAAASTVDAAGWRLAWLEELLRPDWPFRDPEPGARQRLGVVLADRWDDRFRRVAGIVFGPDARGRRLSSVGEVLHHAARLAAAPRRSSQRVGREVDPVRRDGEA